LDQNAELWTEPVSILGLQLIDVKFTQIQCRVTLAAEEEIGHEDVQSAELLFRHPPEKDTFAEAQSGYRPPEVAPAPGEHARLDRLL
jgi:hypothetical protein